MTHRYETGPSGPPPPTRLHVLVADDDAASRRFLMDALRVLGVDVTASADGIEALTQARRQSFDLLLLDCRMPGAGASDVLGRLRTDPNARSQHAVAVATTAELDPLDRQQLLDEGFCDILIKPCQLDDLRRMMAFAPAPLQPLPVLDDEAALIATGDSNTMLALRQLLQQELIAVCSELDYLSADTSAFRDRLHRLRSSCGFCGATALADQVALLQKQLSTSPVGARAALARFRAVLVDTLEALDQPRVPA